MEWTVVERRIYAKEGTYIKRTRTDTSYRFREKGSRKLRKSSQAEFKEATDRAYGRKVASIEKEEPEEQKGKKKRKVWVVMYQNSYSPESGNISDVSMQAVGVFDNPINPQQARRKTEASLLSVFSGKYPGQLIRKLTEDINVSSIEVREMDADKVMNVSNKIDAEMKFKSRSGNSYDYPATLVEDPE